MDWFRKNKGRIVEWPEPLDGGLFLISKGKAIYKPAGLPYVRSIRLNLGSKYPDGNVNYLPNGRWTLRYYQETLAPGKRDAAWSNKALVRNMQDGVPFGVFEQVQAKPDSRYRVVGLGIALSWHDGFFDIQSWAPANASQQACPITGCTEPKALAKARLDGQDVLLRADLAALTAAALLSVKGGLLWVSPDIGDPIYRALHGKKWSSGSLATSEEPEDSDPPWRSQG